VLENTTLFEGVIDFSHKLGIQSCENVWSILYKYGGEAENYVYCLERVLKP